MEIILCFRTDSIRMTGPIFLLMVISIFSIVLATERRELRCFCNLPICIPNSYMCKATGPNGKCFFLLEKGRVSVQGCTHLLPAARAQFASADDDTIISSSSTLDNNQKYNWLEDAMDSSLKNPSSDQHCDYNQLDQPFNDLVILVRQRQQESINRERRYKSSKKPNKLTPISIVGCCRRNMCNHEEYINTLEARLKYALNVNTSSQLFSSQSVSRDLHKPQDSRSTNPIESQENYSDQEMWFKVAVITVPIIGGFIMFILVFIAFRLLRQDAYLRHKHYLLYTDKSYSSPISVTSTHQDILTIEQQQLNNCERQIPSKCTISVPLLQSNSLQMAPHPPSHPTQIMSSPRRTAPIPPNTLSVRQLQTNFPFQGQHNNTHLALGSPSYQHPPSSSSAFPLLAESYSSPDSSVEAYQLNSNSITRNKHAI